MINATAAPWNYRPMTMTGYQGHPDQLALVVNFSQRYKRKRRQENGD
jgi:hypothetical protein